MKISHCMTPEVEIVTPEDTIQSAARIMATIDAGFLPVRKGDRLVGVVTDRDIAIRAAGAGIAPSAPVGDVMTREVKYCFEDEEIDDVLDHMSDLQLRRMPVLNRQKRLVGIVSLSDLAVEEMTEAGRALTGISRPSALHSQMI